MQIQDNQNIFNYLTYDDKINPMKLIFEDINSEDEDKENKQKVSKIKDDCGQIVNILVDKELNSQLSSNISDTKSFYRANGLGSKIEAIDISSNSSTREQLFKEWQEKKYIDLGTKSGHKTPQYQKSEKKGHLESSCEKQNEYLTAAQVIQKYHSSRVGYGDGKISAPVKTTTRPQSPKFQTTKRSVVHALKQQIQYVKNMH